MQFQAWLVLWLKAEGVLVALPAEGRGSVQYLGLCFLDAVVGLYFCISL